MYLILEKTVLQLIFNINCGSNILLDQFFISYFIKIIEYVFNIRENCIKIYKNERESEDEFAAP